VPWATLNSIGGALCPDPLIVGVFDSLEDQRSGIFVGGCRTGGQRIHCRGSKPFSVVGLLATVVCYSAFRQCDFWISPLLIALNRRTAIDFSPTVFSLWRIASGQGLEGTFQRSRRRSAMIGTSKLFRNGVAVGDWQFGLNSGGGAGDPVVGVMEEGFPGDAVAGGFFANEPQHWFRPLQRS